MIKESDSRETIGDEGSSAFDDMDWMNPTEVMARKARDHEYPMIFWPAAWKAFDNSLKIEETDWKTIKYYTNGEKNRDLLKIPDDKGGIYIYYIKPDCIPIGNYVALMYVGRAHYGKNTQNLRKRVNSYDGEVNNRYKGRPSIRKLFHMYKDFLYVMYITVDGNRNIDRLEEELLVAIAPPINENRGRILNVKKMF